MLPFNITVLLIYFFGLGFFDDGLAYYWSTPRSETSRPTRVYITGDNARASKSVKKQFAEKMKPTNVQPENLDVKFG